VLLRAGLAVSAPGGCSYSASGSTGAAGSAAVAAAAAAAVAAATGAGMAAAAAAAAGPGVDLSRGLGAGFKCQLLLFPKNHVDLTAVVASYTLPKVRRPGCSSLSDCQQAWQLPGMFPNSEMYI